MHLLHENMQAKDRELVSVLQRNRELQNEYEQLSATYADRYADERSMYETQLVELRQRLMDLQDKFNSLSAFSENKDEMEQKLASYQVRISPFRTISLQWKSDGFVTSV
jgi:phage host-nuclease inhibitor protein Gam